MLGTTKSVSVVLILFAVIIAQLTLTKARSLRTKRQSGEHVQLHRRRRQLENMYNRLVVLYKLIDHNQNLNTIRPVSIQFNQPDNEAYRQIVKALNSPYNAPVNSRISRGSGHLPRLPSLELDRVSTLRSQSDDSLARGRVGRHFIYRLNHHAKSSHRQVTSDAIPLGNGLQMRVTSGTDTSQWSQYDLRLLQNVIQLCQIVNRKVNGVTSGVTVKACSLN